MQKHFVEFNKDVASTKRLRALGRQRELANAAASKTSTKPAPDKTN
jgi:hypothetical protein